MSTPTKKTFGEFFAGIGLMRLGLERTGLAGEQSSAN